MDRVEKTCLAGLLSLPLGVGAIAFSFLSTPLSISCNSVDQQDAVAMRLQCAQQRAARQTPDSLTMAIELLSNVPADDPYFEQSKQLVERWSIELLAKAEAEFQAGNLEKAVAMARSIPEAAKIKAWQSTWEKGEAVMKTALDQVEQQQWQQALQTAGQLRHLGNAYWATEQYDLLTKQIQSDREVRDWASKNSGESQKTLNEPERIAPPLPEVAQFTRPPWSPENDATVFRSVSDAPEFPTRPPAAKLPPAAVTEIAPEPPAAETGGPLELPEPDPPNQPTESAGSRDRT